MNIAAAEDAKRLMAKILKTWDNVGTKILINVSILGPPSKDIVVVVESESSVTLNVTKENVKLFFEKIAESKPILDSMDENIDQQLNLKK